MLVYAEISIEVGNNCGAGTCTVHTQTDLEVLHGYVQNSATLQPASDGGFTITIQSNCGETTYTLNSCFLNNADINKDGTINSIDIEMLAHLILEHYKDK